MIDISVDLSSPEVQALNDRPIIRAGKLQVLITDAEVTANAAGSLLLKLKLTPAAPEVTAEDGSSVDSKRVVLFHTMLLTPKGGMTVDRIVQNVGGLVGAAKLTGVRLPDIKQWAPRLKGVAVTAMISIDDEHTDERTGKTYQRSNSVRYFTK